MMQDHELQLIARKYSRLIRSAVARVAGPSTDLVAEDVEQEVLFSMWRAMPGEQMPTHPSSYLYRAAIRETVRVLKETRNTRPLEDGADTANVSPDPDKLAEAAELGGAIRMALSEISRDRQRAATAHLAGYDVREIMAMFDWTYNKARNLIARGMKDLRGKLEARGYRD